MFRKCATVNNLKVKSSPAAHSSVLKKLLDPHAQNKIKDSHVFVFGRGNRALGGGFGLAPFKAADGAARERRKRLLPVRIQTI